MKELKARLSEYLRRVDRGERLSVTSHGRVVAELSPASDVPPPSAELRRLEADGIVALSKVRKPPDAPPLRRGSGKAADRLVEEREGRF